MLSQIEDEVRESLPAPLKRICGEPCSGWPTGWWSKSFIIHEFMRGAPTLTGLFNSAWNKHLSKVDRELFALIIYLTCDGGGAVLQWRIRHFMINWYRYCAPLVILNSWTVLSRLIEVDHLTPAVRSDYPLFLLLHFMLSLLFWNPGQNINPSDL